MQINDIIELLDIKDENIVVKDVVIKGSCKEILLEQKIREHYCPICSFRMYSKGIYVRHVNHPILQDGTHLTLTIRQRRWQCSNPTCRNMETDKFSLVDSRKRNTNVTDLLIVKAFKDPQLSVSQIAKQFNVSDTYAFYTFARYVNMERRTLPKALSVDEVFLDVGKDKYALVLQDFVTGEPIDLVINRRKEITEPYFASIPISEKLRVKYLISDMYKPYVAYVDQYFPNAVSVVDSFHVIKLINDKLSSYIRGVIRRLNDRDLKRHEELEQRLGRHIQLTHSSEYKLMKHYQWVLLANESNLNYSKPRFDRRFNMYMYVGDYERKIFEIEPNLKELRELKNLYIRFNSGSYSDLKAVRRELGKLIAIYRKSRHRLFNEVADSLESYFEEILNSFVMIEKLTSDGPVERRLSNGPIEALNRIPKDMKRHARGFSNFDHVRNRFLFSQRKNAYILGTPRTMEEIQKSTGKKRGHYKKD